MDPLRGRHVDLDAVAEVEQPLGALALPHERVEGGQERRGPHPPGEPRLGVEEGRLLPALHGDRAQRAVGHELGEEPARRDDVEAVVVGEAPRRPDAVAASAQEQQRPSWRRRRWGSERPAPRPGRRARAGRSGESNVLGLRTADTSPRQKSHSIPFLATLQFHMFPGAALPRLMASPRWSSSASVTGPRSRTASRSWSSSSGCFVAVLSIPPHAWSPCHAPPQQRMTLDRHERRLVVPVLEHLAAAPQPAGQRGPVVRARGGRGTAARGCG